MIILDKPYVSDFLKETIEINKLEVVDTGLAKKINFGPGVRLLGQEEAIEKAKSGKRPLIYTNSENAIGWVAENLPFTDLPGKIELFKDKVKFRKMLEPLFPDFFYREVQLDRLRELDVDSFPFPFIIKPSVGFFSMGVYKVTGPGEWPKTIDSIYREMAQVKDLYPLEVLDGTSFIIEQCIPGEEYAMDAYFNEEGEPVILNILKHVFSSIHDVSDRVYMTSKDIIQENLAEFTAFLEQIRELAELKNFPVHVEMRRTSEGKIIPIEINPLRFGGWCTTADLAYFAYGHNPYLYYLNRKKPDWPKVLEGKEGKIYSIVILDNSTGKEAGEIETFDYDRLLKNFEKPLELRKIDYREYPIFGFLFVETRQDNFKELEHILKSDLKEFIELVKK